MSMSIGTTIFGSFNGMDWNIDLLEQEYLTSIFQMKKKINWVVTLDETF